MFERFNTTGIGSMPHTDVFSACELILKSFDISFWPQMPKYSDNEQMITQFCEGFPGIVFSSGKVYIKKDDETITEWLINYQEDMVSPISKEFAKGLYTMRQIINQKKLKIFKGQITGPLTFTLSLRDQQDKIIYFDETLREVALMHLKAKAKWQIDFLKKFVEKLIIFIDEPILQAVGTSAYISVEQSEAIRLIKELVSFIKSQDVITGIHCCGRTDWNEILSLDIDILSFDAFYFFDYFKIYRDELDEFINKKRYIAWGLIPTTDELNTLTDEELINQAIRKIEEISKILPSIYDASLITPSCGMGSLDISSCERVCNLLKKIKNKLTDG